MRYVDDLLLFGDEKKTLWAWKAAAIERLAALRLTSHPGGQPHPVTEGFPFLGFTIYPDRRRLKRRKGIHYRRKLLRQIAAYRQGRFPRQKLRDGITGWANYVRFGNTIGLRKAIFRDLSIISVTQTK